jgi:CRP/FNR family cyclic AMP-dependent transcriptional regulator
VADRKVDQLKKMPIFAQCTKSEFANLAMNADEIDIAAGRTLIVQGEPNHTFYLLLKGEVEVDVRGLPPVRLEPGDFFGEISMVAPGAATATVVTRSPVEALVMSHAQFHNAVKADENIALRVLAVMAERLRRVQAGEATQPQHGW